MTPRRPHRRPPKRGVPQVGKPADRLDDVLRELEAGASPGTPDVAGAVLERLGYRRVSRRDAWRRTLRVALRRTGSLFCVLTIIGVGFYALDTASREQGRARAIDHSVRSAVRERGEWLGEVVEGLRPVSQIPASLLQPSPGGEVEGDRPLPSVEPVSDPHEPPAAPAVAPFRQA